MVIEDNDIVVLWSFVSPLGVRSKVPRVQVYTVSAVTMLEYRIFLWGANFRYFRG